MGDNCPALTAPPTGRASGLGLATFHLELNTRSDVDAPLPRLPAGYANTLHILPTLVRVNRLTALMTKCLPFFGPTVYLAAGSEPIPGALTVDKEISAPSIGKRYCYVFLLYQFSANLYVYFLLACRSSVGIPSGGLKSSCKSLTSDSLIRVDCDYFCRPKRTLPLAYLAIILPQ